MDKISIDALSAILTEESNRVLLLYQECAIVLQVQTKIKMEFVYWIVHIIVALNL